MKLISTSKAVFKKSALALALCSAISAPAMAKELTILVDASLSNPMLVDAAFNKRAAEFVAKEIVNLKARDTISVQTFGSLQETTNFEMRSMKLSRHNHKKVARAIAKYLMSLPETLKPQGSTNLLAWFNRNPMDCKQGGKILVITDAIEASEYVNPNKLLEGKQGLPAPSQFVNIRGCEVTLYGVGAGRLDRETMRLRQAWAEYFKQAGAKYEAVIL